MSQKSVSIASTMRFHYEKLAIQLSPLNGFSKWYSFIRSKQVSCEVKDKLCTVSNIGLFFNVLGRRLTYLSPRLGVFVKSLGDAFFDFEVLINLCCRSKCKIFVGLSLNITWSGLYIKNNGGKFILDVPIAHPLYMNKSLCGEFSEFNLEYIDHSQFHIQRMQKSLSIADHIVCPSDFVKSSLVEYNVDPKKISVIPYGCSKVGDKQIHKDKDNVDINTQKQFNVLFVGQLSIRKGLHYLLSAFADLKVPNKHLYLIGSKVAETDTILSKFDLANTSMLGVCDKNTLDFYYKNADIFVLPSLVEGLALVIGEALAYGLPIIYTYETGGTNLLTNYKNGLLIQSKSSLEIQSAIELLSSNSDLRRKISDNNIKLSTHLQGWDTYGESWKKLLSHV